MKLFRPQVKKLIENKDFDTLNELLANNSNLVDEGIAIPFDPFCLEKAHPLHRICDGVFVGKISDSEAVSLAKIFLDHGADIDGEKIGGKGTPLLAAASLHAEQVGIFYIDNGADVHFTHKNDGASALHWAAFCGLDKLVERLIKANAATDEPDKEHKSTPMAWAIHCLMSNDKANIHEQVNCIKLLIKGGADSKKLDSEKEDFLYSLAKDDLELQNLLD